MSRYENLNSITEALQPGEPESNFEQRAAMSRLLVDAAFLAGGATLEPIKDAEGNIRHELGYNGYRLSPTLEQMEQIRSDNTALEYSRDAEAPHADQSIITMRSLLPDVITPERAVSIEEFNAACQDFAVADRKQYSGRLRKPNVWDTNGIIRSTKKVPAHESGYGYGVGDSYLTYITEGNTNRLLSVTYEAPKETSIKDQGITLCYGDDHADLPKSIATVLHHIPYFADDRVLSPLAKLEGKQCRDTQGVVDAVTERVRELDRNRMLITRNTFEITFGKEPSLEFYHSDSTPSSWRRKSGVLFEYIPERGCFINKKNGVAISIGVDVATAMVRELLGVLSVPSADPLGYR